LLFCVEVRVGRGLRGRAGQRKDKRQSQGGDKRCEG
jgi:hypothetical protein